MPADPTDQPDPYATRPEPCACYRVPKWQLIEVTNATARRFQSARARDDNTEQARWSGAMLTALWLLGMTPTNPLTAAVECPTIESVARLKGHAWWTLGDPTMSDEARTYAAGIARLIAWADEDPAWAGLPRQLGLPAEDFPRPRPGAGPRIRA